MEQNTVIRVTKQTRKKLADRGNKGDSYDNIINELIDKVEWFETQT